MNILTGNDLKSGEVLWWAGDERWSLHLADAADAGDEGDAILAREEAARRINSSYVVEADLVDGLPLPRHIKERIRAHGPTVRADLAINTAIPVTKG